MGTNYYLVDISVECCPTCGKHKEEPWRYHIGKSSAGWCFAVHVDKDEGILSLDDLLPKFTDPRYRIEDEYDRVISAVEMCQIIMDRAGKPTSNNTPEFLSQNHAIVGPRNLLRATGGWVYAHGEGTWDYFTGEFS